MGDKIRQVRVDKSTGVVEIAEFIAGDPEYMQAFLERIKAYLGPWDYEWFLENALRYGIDERMRMLALTTGDLSQLDDIDLMLSWEWLTNRHRGLVYDNKPTEQCVAAGKRVAEELPARGVAVTGEPELAAIVGLQKAQWTQAYINDLPDSAFLLIEDGGEKDDDGKTKPRSLRHFPYMDKDGEVDLPHLRNAIARIPQAKIDGMSADDLTKLQEKARKILEGIKKSDGDTRKVWKAAARVQKADDELQVIYCIAVDADAEDTHGEYISKAEATRIAHEYLRKTGGRPVWHNHDAPMEAEVVESWIAKSDGTLGTEPVKEGDWCVGIHIPNKETFAIVKAIGTGISIGGYRYVTTED